MKRKKLRITEADYLKANRRASRQEEIESHGHPVQGRAMIHKSKKVYDRNRMKRAAIKSDDSLIFYVCHRLVRQFFVRKVRFLLNICGVLVIYIT